MEKINFKNGESGSTPLNADNLNLLQDNIENAIYYKTGDVFKSVYNHGYTFAGVISGSKKSLFFSMYTPKSLKNISSFSVKDFTFNLRHNGTYVGAGSGYNYATDTENYTIELGKADEHSIRVIITSVEDWCDTNNISLTVDFASFEIELN